MGAHKLSVLFGIIFLVIGLIGGLLFMNYSYNKMEKILGNKIGESLLEQANMKAGQVNDLLSEQERLLDKLKREELLIDFLKLSPSDEEYKEVFDQIMLNLEYSKLISIDIMNIDGLIVASKDKNLIGNNFSISSKFQNNLTLEKSYSIYPDNTSSGLGIGLITPIRDPLTGETLGILRSMVPYEKLISIVRGSNDTGELEEAYIIDKDFLLLTPSSFLGGENRGVLVQSVKTNNSDNCFLENSFENLYWESVRYFLDYRGEIVMGTHRKISESGWCLLVEIDKNEAIDIPLKEFILKKSFFVFLGVLLFGLIGLLIGRVLDGKKIKLKEIKILEHARDSLASLDLKYFAMFSIIITAGYLFLAAYPFQGWWGIKFFDNLTDLMIFIVAFMIFAVGLKIKNMEASHFITLGGLLICLGVIFNIPVKEYQIIANHIASPSLWVLILATEFIGFVLLLVGYRRSKYDS